MKIAVQLYSLRDIIKGSGEELLAILPKIKALGEGNCDIPEVVRAAKDIGIEWLIVENDDPVPNGLDDIGRSIKYLKSII